MRAPNLRVALDEDAARTPGTPLLNILPVAMACAVPVQDPLQILSSVRVFQLRDRFGRSEADEVPTAIAALRAEIDDPVRGLDHIEIVLDDDDRPSRID